MSPQSGEHLRLPSFDVHRAPQLTAHAHVMCVDFVSSVQSHSEQSGESRCAVRQCGVQSSGGVDGSTHLSWRPRAERNTSALQLSSKLSGQVYANASKCVSLRGVAHSGAGAAGATVHVCHAAAFCMYGRGSAHLCGYAHSATAHNRSHHDSRGRDGDATAATPQWRWTSPLPTAARRKRVFALCVRASSSA